MKPTGIFVPLITPLRDGRVDFESQARLVDHVLAGGPAGLMMFGTTGERFLLTEEETQELVDRTLPHLGPNVPLYLAVGGANPVEIEADIRRFEKHAVRGYLVGCPSYIRPQQAGLIKHYRRIADLTQREIWLYNIPFRSAVNLENDTAFELSKVTNIIGIKDVCGDLLQSFDLLRRRPPEFTVLAGQDPHFFANLAHGADGGVIAAAHLATKEFVELDRCMRAGDLLRGRELWARLGPLIDALFSEPSPVGVKYALWREGVIRSAECRHPLTATVPENARLIDQQLSAIRRA